MDPNLDFREILEADLDRIAARLPIEEIGFVATWCSINGGVVAWTSKVRAEAATVLESRVARALRKLPYVAIAERDGVAEPDVSVDASRGKVNLEPARSAGTIARTWGAIKVRYR